MTLMSWQIEVDGGCWRCGVTQGRTATGRNEEGKDGLGRLHSVRVDFIGVVSDKWPFTVLQPVGLC